MANETRKFETELVLDLSVGELFRECGSVYAMLTEAKSALDATREVQGSIINFLTGGGKDA